MSILLPVGYRRAVRPDPTSGAGGGGGGGGVVPGDWAAEPGDAGWVTVLETNFATIPNTPFPNVNADGFTRTSEVQSATLEANDGTKPGGVGGIYRIHYPTNTPGGYSPSRLGWVGTWPTNTGNLWLGYTFRLSPNWDNDGANGTNAGTKHVFWGYEGPGANGMNHFVGIDTSERAANRQWWHVGLQVPDQAIQTHAEIIPGNWYRCELKVTPNEPGVANGSIEGWVNGVKVLERINNTLIWASNQTNVRQNRHWWDPTYGGGTESPPAAQWFDLGTIKVRVR